MPNAWANAAVPPGTGTSSETTDAADGGARTSATNAATRDAASGRYTGPYFPPAGGQVECGHGGGCTLYTWNNSPQEMASTTYTEKDITVLEGLEPVRNRPGMY